MEDGAALKAVAAHSSVAGRLVHAVLAAAHVSHATVICLTPPRHKWTDIHLA